MRQPPGGPTWAVRNFIADSLYTGHKGWPPGTAHTKVHLPLWPTACCYRVLRDCTLLQLGEQGGLADLSPAVPVGDDSSSSSMCGRHRSRLADTATICIKPRGLMQGLACQAGSPPLWHVRIYIYIYILAGPGGGGGDIGAIGTGAGCDNHNTDPCLRCSGVGCGSGVFIRTWPRSRRGAGHAPGQV